MKDWSEERIDRRVWKRLPGNPFADYDPADGIALWSLWEMPSFSVGKLVRRGPGRPRSKPTAVRSVRLPVETWQRLETEAAAKKTSVNSLLASPSLASWRQGTTLDVAEWVAPKNGTTPIVVISVAHLDDEERTLVLGVLLEELLSWVRSLPGSQRLRALLVFDEVYGFLPPHPANPPTKRPVVALMKQARAFGVVVVVATQNPMDLDYHALSNAGVWCLGRLQTDAHRARVIDGLAAVRGSEAVAHDIDVTLQRLAPRWFVIRNTHAGPPLPMQPRYAMTYLRGPMTRVEIRKARGVTDPVRPETPAPEPEPPTEVRRVGPFAAE